MFGEWIDAMSFCRWITACGTWDSYFFWVYRCNLVEWYCKLQLRAYRSVFKPNEEVSALDNTSRRYAWLKRLLKIHDEEHAQIFPPAWDVSRDLCLQFCQITRYVPFVCLFLKVRPFSWHAGCNSPRPQFAGWYRSDLADILAKTKSTVSVPLLLQVLQLTLDFETQLENRFLNKACLYQGDTSSLNRPLLDSLAFYLLIILWEFWQT